MNNKIINLSLSLLAVFSIAGSSVGAQERDSINILYIGNSFTFRHDMPYLVEKLVREGKPNVDIYTETVVAGGQSMYQHAELFFSQTIIEQSTITNEEIRRRIEVMTGLSQLTEPPEEFIHHYEVIRGGAVKKFPDCKKAIKTHEDLLVNNPKRKWDYVVLQTWKDEYPDMNKGYAKYAKKLGEIARAQGAKVIFYWTAPNFQNMEPVSEPLSQDVFDEQKNTMLQLCREFKPFAVVPVPVAVNTIQQGGTDYTFRYVHDGHPNQRCAFVTANMFYAALFNESTEGFDFNTVVETAVKKYNERTGEDPEGTKDPDGNDPTVVFEDPEKTYLQQMAYDSFVEFDRLWKVATGLSEHDL